MTVEEMRELLGLDGSVPDETVVQLYAEYLLAEGDAQPTRDDLVQRYPEFSGVDPGVVAFWIDDAGRSVDASWAPADRPVARIALAAHNMALGGLLASGTAAQLPQGVTSFRSGSFSATVSEAAVSQTIKGGFSSTRYGRDYLALLRSNKGGPRVSSGGVVPAWGGILPGWAGW